MAAHETCEECGFHASRWTAARAADRLRELGRDWRGDLEAFTDEQLRARPAPTVWSPLEYAVHTARTVAWWNDAIVTMQAGGEVAVTEEGYPDADRYPYNELTLADAQAELDAAFESLATLTAPMGDEGDPPPLRVLGNPGLESAFRNAGFGDARGGALHAFHDALHHLADIRRGPTSALRDDSAR